MRTVLALASVTLLLGACEAAPDVSTTATAERLTSPSPSAFGSPVTRVVLSPASVPPVTGLCWYPVYSTADGNFEPRFCSEGSINVVAWRRYATMSPHLLAAGPSAGPDQITAAMKADSRGNLTNVELLDSYQLAAAYYGWSFSPNPACELIYEIANCY